MKLAAAALLSCCTLLAKNPLTDAVKGHYENAKQNLIESAEAMPETEYGFKPTAQQRTFGNWIEHTIDATYSYCSSMRGLTHLMRDAPDENKASLVEVLKKAFQYCDETLATMTDEKALAEIPMGETKKIYPATYMVSMVAGLNEHYGNLTSYLRLKGITPPSTARGQHSHATK